MMCDLHSVPSCVDTGTLCRGASVSKFSFPTCVIVAETINDILDSVITTARENLIATHEAHKAWVRGFENTPQPGILKTVGSIVGGYFAFGPGAAGWLFRSAKHAKRTLIYDDPAKLTLPAAEQTLTPGDDHPQIVGVANKPWLSPIFDAHREADLLLQVQTDLQNRLDNGDEKVGAANLRIHRSTYSSICIRASELWPEKGMAKQRHAFAMRWVRRAPLLFDIIQEIKAKYPNFTNTAVDRKALNWQIGKVLREDHSDLSHYEQNWFRSATMYGYFVKSIDEKFFDSLIAKLPKEEMK